MGMKDSKAIWQHLKESGLIDAKGNVQDALRKQLKDGTFRLPESYADQTAQVSEILKKLSGKLDIKNADERTAVSTRAAILDGEEFRALWDRIKYKTTYRVEFDNEKLLRDCIEAIKAAP